MAEAVDKARWPSWLLLLASFPFVAVYPLAFRLSYLWTVCCSRVTAMGWDHAVSAVYYQQDGHGIGIYIYDYTTCNISF